MRHRLDKHAPPIFCNTFFLPRYWPVWILIGIFRVAALLPLKLNLKIGKLLGSLFYRFASVRRYITEVNIKHCFPELPVVDQDLLVHQVMESCGMSFMETAMALWGLDQFRNCHSIMGCEHLEKAQAEGKGVLLLGSHLTTMDAAGKILSQYYTYDTLYRKDANPVMAWALTTARNRYVNQSIVRNNTRQLITNLKKGNIVWYAADQDFGARHGVFAPFFNIQAASLSATSRIASLGKALVLPLSHYRDNSGRYHVEIGAPLDNFPSGDDVADASRINRIIEDMIRKAPGQYLWVHKRFKTRPIGEKSFY